MAADAVLFPADLPFYIGCARRFGGPVLDLGSGTGRVAVALADTGVTVVGLELHAAMLRRAEAKRRRLRPELQNRLRIVAGDMAAFDLPRYRGAFTLAVAPFRAFQLLPTAAAGRAMLGCVHRHLRPGGWLALDLSDPRPATEAETATELPGVRNPATGRFVRVFVEGQRLDEDGRLLREQWRFVEIDGAGRPLREEAEELALRWTAPEEMRALFAETGFHVAAEYRDFAGTPAAPDDAAGPRVWLVRKE